MSSIGFPHSPEQLRENAAHWRDQLPARAAEFEQARQLPAEIADGFRSAGFFHMLVPSEYQGSEIHPRVFSDVIREVSRGDGSAGWNVMIGSTTGLLSASLPDEFARQMYQPGSLSVGVTAPVGKAHKTEGGYLVSGRWQFGSGCQNADWICGGCFLYADGEQLMGPKGIPEVQLMMFSRDQIEIEDTWHVTGLKGTGSHHFSVTEQFVPEGRAVVLGGRTRVQRPLYQFPLLGLLAIGVSSVSLGIAQHAAEAFADLAGAKTPTGSRRTLINRAQVQADYAMSLADLRSAQAFIYQAIDEAWQLAENGERLPQQIKANLRLAAANATWKSVEVVDRLYNAAGGSAIYDSNVLQQCFRDVHVSTQHIMVARPLFEVVGRVELGLEAGSLL